MKARLLALRPSGPWLLRDALRVVLVVLLAAVSAWYLTRWGLANRIPVGLAWTLPVLADASALLGIVVAKHPRDESCRRKATRFAWASAGLSAVGNGAMHAVDFQAVEVSIWTVVLTGALYPLFLAWGYDVAGGMAARPGGVSVPQDVETPRTVAELASERVTEPATPWQEQPPPAPPDPAPAAEDATPPQEQFHEWTVEAATDWALGELRAGNGPVGWKKVRTQTGLTEGPAGRAARAAKATHEREARPRLVGT
ncbi:hypothetical protein EV383_4327 [Pseudonocardia sediminis]|uniref:DUF2637 domain-containing protein n=1 Tax=Pseudonocardia sediminis TaxID=1397368 RepID=A0A4Q7V1R0_PSEST|nr:hypothetical protein [Pseudonocardia sediminis]RZT87404.1 hypothetical protein EV383_4327 [Pseudonocardia sediminis]